MHGAAVDRAERLGRAPGGPHGRPVPLPLLADVTSTLARRPSSRRDGAPRERLDCPRQRPTIVCGVDASASAPEVLRVAAELGDLLAARLVVVHVVPDDAVPGASDVPGAADALKVVEAERGHGLLAGLDAGKLEARTERLVTFGSPAPALEAIARREGADLVVVGCRGRGTLASVVLGSVSSHLSKFAHCPVVVVPPSRARSEARNLRKQGS